MLDLLVLAAHPDDAEIFCGGLLAHTARRGRRAGVLDLTRGELGSRGTPEIRAAEAEAATTALGLAVRRNAGIPDGGIDPFDPAQRLAVIAILRELRPTVLVLPWHEVRHPDHGHAGRLGEEAAFRSGLHAIVTGHAPFRPSLVLYHQEWFPFEATLVVDVSGDHETKMKAIRCYRSQFERKEGDPEPATHLTRPDFLTGIAARDRAAGERSGFGHGEAYRSRGPLPLADLALLFPGDRR